MEIVTGKEPACYRAVNMFRTKVKYFLPRAAITLADKENIIKALTTTMRTGTIHQQHIISENYLIYKSSRLTLRHLLQPAVQTLLN